MACENAIGEGHKQYYMLLSELLILNPKLLKKNDTRFSAQLTFILFNEETIDKEDLVCKLLESNENNLKTRVEVIGYTKSLLDLDPKLVATNKILSELKALDNLNYSELMRKVNVKHVMNMYHSGETKFARRI